MQDLQIKVAPTLHWHEAFVGWLHSTPTQKRRERSHLTLDAYQRDIAQMGMWFSTLNNSEFEPGHLNNADLRTYFAQLEKTSAPATYNRKLASARMLIKWSMQVGYLDYDPAEWIPFADATRKSPRDVNSEERIKLEVVADAGEGSLLGMRDSLIFFLMSDAGLRESEVITLKLTDLHLDRGYIHILGKGSKHRDVKIGSRLSGKIEAWMDHGPVSIEGMLITDEKGHSICRTTAWRAFTALAEQAGVKTTPHAMRHTYVLRYMDAYMQGDPWKLPAAIDAVCQQTGDRPEVILAYYTRARESDMRAAAEMM